MAKIDFKRLHEVAKSIYKKGKEKYSDAVKRAHEQIEKGKK